MGRSTPRRLREKKLDSLWLPGGNRSSFASKDALCRMTSTPPNWDRKPAWEELDDLLGRPEARPSDASFASAEDSGLGRKVHSEEAEKQRLFQAVRPSPPEARAPPVRLPRCPRPTLNLARDSRATPSPDRRSRADVRAAALGAVLAVDAQAQLDLRRGGPRAARRARVAGARRGRRRRRLARALARASSELPRARAEPAAARTRQRAAAAARAARVAGPPRARRGRAALARGRARGAGQPRRGRRRRAAAAARARAVVDGAPVRGDPRVRGHRPRPVRPHRYRPRARRERARLGHGQGVRDAPPRARAAPDVVAARRGLQPRGACATRRARRATRRARGALARACLLRLVCVCVCV